LVVDNNPRGGQGAGGIGAEPLVRFIRLNGKKDKCMEQLVPKRVGQEKRNDN